jgi:hypothetical protein
MPEIKVVYPESEYEIKVGYGGYLLLIYKENFVHMVYHSDESFWCPPYISREMALATFKKLYGENRVGIQKEANHEAKNCLLNSN